MTEIIIPGSPPQEMRGFAASSVVIRANSPVNSELDIDTIFPSRSRGASFQASGGSNSWYTESTETSQSDAPDFTTVEVCRESVLLH